MPQPPAPSRPSPGERPSEVPTPPPTSEEKYLDPAVWVRYLSFSKDIMSLFTDPEARRALTELGRSDSQEDLESQAAPSTSAAGVTAPPRTAPAVDPSQESEGD